MTPKEKAQDLFEVYLLETGFESFAKNCALIAVNEILVAITFNMYDEEFYNEADKFWKEVKHELEKI